MSLRLFPRLSAHFVRPAAPLRAAVRSMTTSAPRSSPTPSSLRSQAQFFSRSLRPTVHSLPAAGSSSTAGRATSWAPSSFTSTFLRRAFATGRRGGGGPFPFRRPPPRRYSEPGFFSKLRNRIDRWDPKKVLYVLIGVNVAVWGLWEYAKGTYKRFGDATTYIWMVKNFGISEANLKAGRVWTLITGSFSQMDPMHCLVNLIGLWFVTPSVIALTGVSAFLALYLTGGVVSGLASTWYKHYRHRNPTDITLGSSGAIYSCLAFYGTVFPTTTFLLFFIIPMPAWALLGGLTAYEGYTLISNTMGRNDSAGHLGGLLTGIAAGWAVRSGKLRRFIRPRF